MLEEEKSIYTHQAAAVKAIKAQLEKQPPVPPDCGEFEKVSLAVLPTGTGKTGVGILVAYVCEAHRVLIVTPSEAISLQWMVQFKPVAEKENPFRNDPFFLCRNIVSEEDKKKPNVWAPLNSMCVLSKEDLETSQSLNCELVITNAHKFGEDDKKGYPINNCPSDHFSLVIVDEAHHFPAKTWKRIVDHFQGAKLGILFLTATPQNRDGYLLSLRSSGVRVKEPCYEYSVEKAIDDGIIRKITFDEGKNMHENEMSPQVKREKRIEEVLQMVKETLKRHDREDDRTLHKAMVLAMDKDDAKEIARVWNKKIKFGSCKTYVQSDPWRNVLAFKNDSMATSEDSDTTASIDMETDDTHASMEDANIATTEDKTITRVLVVIYRLTEGFDYKQVSVVAILRNVGMKSRVYFAQFVGRAVRKLDCNDPVTAMVLSHKAHKQYPNFLAFRPDKLPDEEPEEPHDK